MVPRPLTRVASRRLCFRHSSGSTMVWSEVVPEAGWEHGKPVTSLPLGGGDGCPIGTQQGVRVTWAGGVTKPGGHEIGNKEREAYWVTVSFGDEGKTDLVPYAIGIAATVTTTTCFALIVLDCRRGWFFLPGSSRIHERT